MTPAIIVAVLTELLPVIADVLTSAQPKAAAKRLRTAWELQQSVDRQAAAARKRNYGA